MDNEPRPSELFFVRACQGFGEKLALHYPTHPHSVKERQSERLIVLQMLWKPYEIIWIQYI